MNDKPGGVYPAEAGQRDRRYRRLAERLADEGHAWLGGVGVVIILLGLWAWVSG